MGKVTFYLIFKKKLYFGFKKIEFYFSEDWPDLFNIYDLCKSQFVKCVESLGLKIYI